VPSEPSELLLLLPPPPNVCILKGAQLSLDQRLFSNETERTHSQRSKGGPVPMHMVILASQRGVSLS
jgi:hypothetical protein